MRDSQLLTFIHPLDPSFVLAREKLHAEPKLHTIQVVAEPPVYQSGGETRNIWQRAGLQHDGDFWQPQEKKGRLYPKAITSSNKCNMVCI